LKASPEMTQESAPGNWLTAHTDGCLTDALLKHIGRSSSASTGTEELFNAVAQSICNFTAGGINESSVLTFRCFANRCFAA